MVWPTAAAYTGKLIHLAHALLILGGWGLFWWVCGGFDLLTLFHLPSTAWWHPLLAVYVVACWFAGIVLLPLVTITRLRRRLPAAVVENQSQLLDVAKELGHPPIGRSKHSLLARLPGNEVFRVEMVEHSAPAARPAAWDGLTILHLTDLHMCGSPDRHFYRIVMQRRTAVGAGHHRADGRRRR